MSITGRERRARRRATVVVVETPVAVVPPAIAAQERKASEQKVERIEADVAKKAPTVHSHAQSDVTGLVAALAAKLDASGYTAADVLAKLLTVDGATSGVDADLLDGQHAAAFAAASHGHDISEITGDIDALTLQGLGPLDFADASHTHAQSDVTNLTTDLAAKAPLASPALTGSPTAPTQVAGTSDTTIATTRFVTRDFANLASPTFTGTPAVPTAAAGTSTTQAASTAFVAAAVPNASYRTILDSSGSHIAARVAGTYGLSQAQPAAISGTGTLYPLNTIYIAAADYPSVNGATPKLRVRAQLYVNDVAPTGNFTFALHPITRPGTSGGAGKNIYTIGAAVSGSAATTITTPAADSMNTTVGSDFDLPADGHYVLGVVTTATVATSSHLHMSASLQLRNA